MTALLNPRVWLAAALAAALLWGGVERVRGSNARQALAEYKLASQQQAERQREARTQTARDAETKHVTQTVYRDRYITRVVKEIDREAAPLAGCPVPLGAVRVLNDAARCAREDRPAACGIDGALPGP